jgi:uncharacterized Zn-binding protein involved in type VI secretion
MKAVARGNGTDTVLSATGTGFQCRFPLVVRTAACSSTVRANGIGVVRQGDAVAVHSRTGCSPESPGLSTFSSTVRANGKGLGRVGDNYLGDGSNTITSGSASVRAGG